MEMFSQEKNNKLIGTGEKEIKQNWMGSRISSSFYRRHFFCDYIICTALLYDSWEIFTISSLFFLCVCCCCREMSGAIFHIFLWLFFFLRSFRVSLQFLFFTHFPSLFFLILVVCFISFLPFPFSYFFSKVIEGRKKKKFSSTNKNLCLFLFQPLNRVAWITKTRKKTLILCHGNFRKTFYFSFQFSCENFHFSITFFFLVFFFSLSNFHIQGFS